MVWLQRFLKYLTVLALTGFVAAFVVIFFVQSDYYQKVRTTESHSYGVNLTKLLTVFYGSNNHYPQELDELQAPKPDKTYVGAISYQHQTGIVTIQVAGDTDDEGILIFEPLMDGESLVYTCHTLRVPAEYLPASCLNE